MSTRIESIHLTLAQWCLLLDAEEVGGPIPVKGPTKRAASECQEKGLGTIAEQTPGRHVFTLNDDGRAQLRIRR